MDLFGLKITNGKTKNIFSSLCLSKCQLRRCKHLLLYVLTYTEYELQCTLDIKKFSSITILFLLKIEFAWCVKCFNEFKYLSNLHCYFFQILTFISIAIRVKVLSWNNNWADTFQLLIKPFKTSTKYLTVSARVNEFYCYYIDKTLSKLLNSQIQNL